MTVYTIWAFRHGQTDWNSSRTLQGHADIPLNGKGIKQAKQLAEFIRGLPLADFPLYSSDLSRAVQTAELCFPGKPIHTHTQLREIHVGALEGMRRKDAIKKFGAEQWERWTKSKSEEDLRECFPDGESRILLKERIKNFVESLLDSEQDQMILSVHGGCVRSLIYCCENIDSFDGHIRNCSLHKFHFESEKSVWSYDGFLFEPR